jgi:hypothetical protein
MEHWKNSIFIAVYRKEDKQKVENCRGICLLNVCYKLYSIVYIENLKAQAEKYHFGCQNWFWKATLCIDPLFTIWYLTEKRRGFNLETHLAFLDYVKSSDRVKRDRLFEILQSNIFLIYY